jgi:predicted esterase
MSAGRFLRSVVLIGSAVLLLSGDAFSQGKARHVGTTPGATTPTATKTPAPTLRYVPPVYRRYRDEIVAGLNPSVRVQAPARFDWAWATPPGLVVQTPKEVMAGYDSTRTRYQLFVPVSYKHARSSPLILFLSSADIPDEFASWATVCRKHDVLYASAHEAGDNCPATKRLRIALDVFDDIRRRMNVDTDRVYLGGFSEGARTACEAVYAFPEFAGGLVAVGGASPLRGEPWLRDRVQERLSIALLTGNLDYSRGEMESYRFPVLHELQVRSKLWVPRVGHAMPPASVLEEVFVWLEADSIRRKALGQAYPTARVAEGAFPSPQSWSNRLVEEAKGRLAVEKTRDSGLMQLEGVVRRWKGSEGAIAAEKILAENAAGAGAWQNVYVRRQQEFFFQEAKGMDAYLDGPLSPRDPRRKVSLIRISLDLWKQVLDSGADTREGKLAKTRVEELKRLLD